MVDNIITKLKKGKAAGIDYITAEHLQFCHPIVTCILVKLFNLMTIFNYVPTDFGRGVIIPIPKGDDKHLHNKVRIIANNCKPSCFKSLRALYCPIFK